VPREALPAALRPYVREVYEEVYPALPTGPIRLPVSASTTPILNVSVGRAWIDFAGREGLWLPPVVLSGCQPEAYAATIYGEMWGFYVTFEPVGPLALFGLRRFWRGETPAPAPLPDLVRPALAARTRAYLDALAGATTFDARAPLTTAFLLDALATAPAADLAEAAFLQRAVDAIEEASGAVRAEALARALGVSPVTLRRRFRVLGVPVKRFAEVVRYRQAHAFLHATPEATWADVVHRFGYADQPHFVRAYRRYSGGPPTRWRPGERAIDLRMGIEGGPGPAGEP
jgi:AraC-like DNA-binding protein